MNYQPSLSSARPYEADTPSYKPKLLLIWGFAALILLALSWEMFLQDSSLSNLMSTKTRLVEIHLPQQLIQQLPKQVSSLKQTTPVPVPPAELPTAKTHTESPSQITEGQWHSYLIKKNDTFNRLIESYAVDPKTIELLMQNKQIKTYLMQLQLNHKISIYIDQHDIKNVLYQLSPTQALVIHKTKNQYESRITRSIQEADLVTATGRVQSNLYQDAQRAGLDAKLIMKLAQIFSSKVNFATAIHPGDHFSVLYEERSFPDQRTQKGDIIAASIIAHGKTYEAVRYVDEQGNTAYFTPQGDSLTSAFLRSPVHYTHVSSSFSLGRVHPVLGIRRPHYGVDLAAPSGTPIHAAADGIVSFIGKRGGYGNVVMIHHADHYATRYAHMSRFNRTLHAGSRVNQGDVIGYVGMTGLADGPHLHYEVRIDNKPKNPMTLNLPSGLPVPKKERSTFVQQAKYYVKLLNQQ